MGRERLPERADAQRSPTASTPFSAAGAPPGPVPLPTRALASNQGEDASPESAPRALDRVRPAAETEAHRAPSPLDGAHSIAHLRRTAAPSSGTPLPAPLQGSLANATGIDVSDVGVHYSSPLPGRIGAAAFTQGDEIHLGPGAESELAHEAWHVIQQRTGRVSSTGAVGGAAINSDADLEKEADVQGHQVAKEAGLLNVAPPTGRAVTQPESASGAAATGPVLQARWLLLKPSTAKFSGYFWDDVGDGRIKDNEPPPTLWARDYQELAGDDAPDPGSYYVQDLGGTRSSRASTKGKSQAYTLESFVAESKGSTSARATHDTYNPFGRFTNSAGAVAFIPALTVRDPAALAANIAERNGKVAEITGRSDQLTDSGLYPQAVTIMGDKVLEIVAEDSIGALYADIDVSNAQAMPVNPAQDPGHLRLVRPVEPTVVHADGVVGNQSASACVKIVQSPDITAQTINSWEGVKRSRDQAQVMGTSAGEVAGNAGYDKAGGRGWEWLHLIAHSMGGPIGTGPQHPENLVVGTSECNSQMIVVEEVLKDLVTRYDLRARLAVTASICDAVRHISDEIKYDFYFMEKSGRGLGVFTWTFDPLARSNPLDAHNLAARLTARYHFGDGKNLHARPEQKDFARSEERMDIATPGADTAPVQADIDTVSAGETQVQQILMQQYGLHWRGGSPRPVSFLEAVFHILVATGLDLPEDRFLAELNARYPANTAAITVLEMVPEDLLDAIALTVHALTDRVIRLTLHGFVVNEDLTVAMYPQLKLSYVRAAQGAWDAIELDILQLPDATFIALYGGTLALKPQDSLWG